MNAIVGELSRIRVGETSGSGAFRVVSLLSEGGPVVAYLTLDEAVGRGLVVVTEVSEGGQVPNLLLENRADRPVLITDGDILIGAKQNRVVNVTILVPAASKLVVPVSCVEAGRWHHRSRSFSVSPRAYYSSGRRTKARSVSASMRAHAGHGSDQGAIWSEIGEKSARLMVQSETSAAEEMYERRSHELEAFEQSLTPVPGQVGALFFVGERWLGMDLFDSAATFARQMPKLVRGYGLDAIDPLFEGAGPAAGGELPDARRWLAGIERATQQSFPGLGLGTDVRLEGPVVGGALLLDDRVVHLSAFPAQ